MTRSYVDMARERGEDTITLSSGLADHWVCTHCKGWSPGKWGETADTIRHEPGCTRAALTEETP